MPRVASPQRDDDDLARAAERVGRTLRGKWHLDALIDMGGMAAVYAATHRNGLRGAVKILHQHRSTDLDIADRFRREGYIANKVVHPNAVSVLDDDVDDDGSAFLVMELLEGTTLRERAAERGGKLGADEVLLAVDQLLDVLAAAHDVGIIHRDVKPDNLMVTSLGQLKILDFGIARHYAAGAQPHSNTMAGLPLGSPAFMSPEQARGRWDLVDRQSDVWSVGATMFTLLSGRDVHEADTVPELLAAIFSKPAPSLSTVLPGVHPALAALVDRALQLHLADRWPDARSMQAAAREVHRALYDSALPVAPQLARSTMATARAKGTAAPASWARRGATTVTAPEVRRRIVPRRIALASAVLTLGALGLVGASWDSSSASPAAIRAAPAAFEETPAESDGMRPVVTERFEATASAPQASTSRPLPVEGGGASPRAAATKSSAPTVHPRLPSVYDRRN